MYVRGYAADAGPLPAHRAASFLPVPPVCKVPGVCIFEICRAAEVCMLTICML